MGASSDQARAGLGGAGTASRPVIGPVALVISNLERATEFYCRGLGLRVHHTEATKVALGAGGEDLLILEEHPEATRPGRTAGLYHVAIVLPDRAALARQFMHFARTGVPLQGESDHGVSEALYLMDPNGNGFEIYHDRPRERWVDRDGRLEMPTEPLNLESLVAELGKRDEPWEGMPQGTVIGHIHLRVADIEESEAFYRDVLGMEVTTRYGAAASFMSYRGYHHHVGINTWGSLGAPPAPEGALGLEHFEVHVPETAQWERTQQAVKERRLKSEMVPQGLRLRDPSGNVVIVGPS